MCRTDRVELRGLGRASFAEKNLEIGTLAITPKRRTVGDMTSGLDERRPRNPVRGTHNI
jgi:hypothetical protein